MRQLSLTAMMLLISVPALSADHHHVRRATTYACVDPRASLASNDPAWHSTTRRQGHCFRARPLHSRSSSPRHASAHDTDRRHSQQHPALPMVVDAYTAMQIIPAAEAPLQLPAPLQSRSVSARRIVAPADPGSIRWDGWLHRSAPFLVWALIVASAFLLVRLVSGRRHVEASASPPIEAGSSLGECRNRCVAGLRLAGWDADSHARTDVRDADVIARNNGRLLAVQCHPSTRPVDAGDVEQACQARAFQGSDLTAIVSNASFTEPARRLAARTGIVLLHEHQLASFAA